MKINLIELEIEDLQNSYGLIFLLNIFHLEWFPDGDCSLFEIGIYNGKFQWDFLFLSYFIQKLFWRPK